MVKVCPDRIEHEHYVYDAMPGKMPL